MNGGPRSKRKKLMPGYHKNIGRGGESVFWLFDNLSNDGDAFFQKNGSDLSDVYNSYIDSVKQTIEGIGQA